MELIEMMVVMGKNRMIQLPEEEVKVIVKGIDSKTRSVVASRRDAMLKKRQIFYLDTDVSGMYRIHEGRIVQAKIGRAHV